MAPTLSRELSGWLQTRRDYLIDLRRSLHQIPELGYEETHTSALLQQILKDAGYAIVQAPAMRTGFYCDLNPSSPGTFAIRADMDALPINEQNNTPYRSQVPNVMHACGHDIHMTVAIGAALFLSENPQYSAKRVRFLFQPAEEQAPGGSLGMIEGGALEGISHILGLHVFPSLKPGDVGIKEGHTAAMVDQVEFELRGGGGHTSRPHLSEDLVHAASLLIQSLTQALASRVDSQDTVVLTFGTINGGTAHNVLPTELNLTGTLRMIKESHKEAVHRIIEDCVAAVNRMTGSQISWNIAYSAPGVYNDPKLTRVVGSAAEDALGQAHVIPLTTCSMGGEDFAFFLREVKGMLLRLGCADGSGADLHSPTFDVDENCIPAGVRVLCHTVERIHSK